MALKARACVEVKGNNVEKGIRDLRRKVASEEVLLTYMDRRYYKSKGERRREDKERAIRREQRKNRKDMKMY